MKVQLFLNGKQVEFETAQAKIIQQPITFTDKDGEHDGQIHLTFNEGEGMVTDVISPGGFEVYSTCWDTFNDLAERTK
jgi:hypothetical protein